MQSLSSKMRRPVIRAGICRARLLIQPARHAKTLAHLNARRGLLYSDPNAAACRLRPGDALHAVHFEHESGLGRCRVCPRHRYIRFDNAGLADHGAFDRDERRLANGEGRDVVSRRDSKGDMIPRRAERRRGQQNRRDRGDLVSRPYGKNHASDECGARGGPPRGREGVIQCDAEDHPDGDRQQWSVPRVLIRAAPGLFGFRRHHT